MASPPSAPTTPSPSHQPSSTDPKLHTYHCLCSTLLLTTPYALSDLPKRVAASGDDARILPLPPLSLDEENPRPEASTLDSEKAGKGQVYLPSLLTNTRTARKAIVVQRDDGWEKRRVWRCGRCALTWGYEVEGAEGEEAKEKGLRVMYVLERGLVETEVMKAGREDG